MARSPRCCQPRSPAQARNQRSARGVVARLRLSGADAATLYADDIKLHGYSPEPMDKAQVRGFYEGLFAALDTPKLDFDEILWDGDACVIRFTMRGRHVAEFVGVPATGAEISLPGITIMHFDGERVIERFSQADMLGVLVQIGAMPAPA